jgi:predicted metal-dependent HD superfamily phosphohydrolase
VTAGPLDDLRRRWHDTVAPFGAPDTVRGEAFARVGAALLDPARRHHGPARLAGALDWVAALDHRARDPVAVRLAVWAAGAAYDARREGDHGACADWAIRELPGLGVSPERIDEVVRLVGLLSAGCDADDEDDDACVLCDAELADVGSADADYRRAVDALRREHGGDDERWRGWRRRVVEDLAGRDSLFRTPELRATREGRAQLNLAREAARAAQRRSGP